MHACYAHREEADAGALLNKPSSWGASDLVHCQTDSAASVRARDRLVHALLAQGSSEHTVRTPPITVSESADGGLLIFFTLSPGAEELAVLQVCSEVILKGPCSAAMAQ
eukprot:206662-Pleurochrysis_carterae.AAC.3